SMAGHFNNMRSFALGDESALLMASWPNGRPKIPFTYFSEVMTGFEYTAAVGMIYEGMENEGLNVIKNIRDRYNGVKRSPFDEAECGHHYARVMASWASVLAITGFHYSVIDKTMKMNARPGKWFWSNGYSWGTVDIQKNGSKYNVELNVLFGKLAVEKFELAGVGTFKVETSSIIEEGNLLQFEI
ncbi:MAG: glycoside hydrolase family 116 protein, partial [Draconibacterium sp.]|nr:glycoside hydrolase family 116 protein [Draconibacterium sp.]